MPKTVEINNQAKFHPFPPNLTTVEATGFDPDEDGGGFPRTRPLILADNCRQMLQEG